MSSKVTGEALDVVLKITANDGTNATGTVDVRGDVSADRFGLTTVVFNGAGAHLDAANGRRRYRLRLEEVL